MAACHCCPASGPVIQERIRLEYPRFRLFNRVTALLLTGWFAIVSAAIYLAGPGQQTPVNTLDAFLGTLF